MSETRPLPRELLGQIRALPFNDSDPSLPMMLRRQAANYGSRCLYVLPNQGAYREVGWEEYLNDVTALARGMVEAGAKYGECVALLSENRYEWRVSDGAVLASGGVVVPLHVGLTGAQVAHEISDSKSRTLIISNQSQADKLNPVADRLAGLERVITLEPIQWSGAQEVYTYQDLVSRGARASGKTVDEQLQRERAIARSDLATIIYTSGTTGVPKGVMLTHDNILFLCDRIRAVIGMRDQEVLLNWLPLSHGFARMADHFTAIMAGCRVAMCESHEVLVQRMSDMLPTAMAAVPRIFEKIFALTSLLPPDEQKRKLKALFGKRMQYLISGGAPLPPSIGEVYLDAGVLILEGYGLTETTAISHFNHPDRYRAGTVGIPIPETQVKIAADGEILMCGRHIMKGYWGMPEATAEVMSGEWFHSGDIGCLDDEGFLVITDRKKDLIVNSAGKKIAPQLVESRLAKVPLIGQVVVFGDRRQYLSAVIVPEWLAVEKLAGQIGLEKKPPAEAVKDPTLSEVMRAYIDDALKDLAPWEQVRKFILVSEPFTIEGGTMTPTLKIRRRQAFERHRKQVEALYEE
jgi:long-chain acyl-CoA synthetase